MELNVDAVGKVEFLSSKFYFLRSQFEIMESIRFSICCLFRVC